MLTNLIKALEHINATDFVYNIENIHHNVSIKYVDLAFHTIEGAERFYDDALWEDYCCIEYDTSRNSYLVRVYLEW